MAAKLKFGVRLNIQGEMGAKSSGFDYTLEMARLAESLGFDSVWIPDHVENAHLDRSKPILEFWTTLSAVGAMTERVRLGGGAKRAPCPQWCRSLVSTSRASRGLHSSVRYHISALRRYTSFCGLPCVQHLVHSKKRVLYIAHTVVTWYRAG